MQELNVKLARWAGFIWHDYEVFETERYTRTDDPYWESPSGRKSRAVMHFTTNLNAIDKWLFPELLKRGFYIGIGAEKSGWECWIFEGEPVEGDPFQEYKVKVLADTLALAICKAIEQLIKEESCLSSK